MQSPSAQSTPVITRQGGCLGGAVRQQEQATQPSTQHSIGMGCSDDKGWLQARSSRRRGHTCVSRSCSTPSVASITSPRNMGTLMSSTSCQRQYWKNGVRRPAIAVNAKTTRACKDRFGLCQRQWLTTRREHRRKGPRLGVAAWSPPRSAPPLRTGVRTCIMPKPPTYMDSTVRMIWPCVRGVILRTPPSGEPLMCMCTPFTSAEKRWNGLGDSTTCRSAPLWSPRTKTLQRPAQSGQQAAGPGRPSRGGHTHAQYDRWQPKAACANSEVRTSSTAA